MEKNSMDEAVGAPLSERDNALAFSVPAVFVDRFMVHNSNSGIRIAFGESIFSTDDARMHVAVKLSLPDARIFVGLLREMVGKLELATEEAMQELVTSFSQKTTETPNDK